MVDRDRGLAARPMGSWGEGRQLELFQGGRCPGFLLGGGDSPLADLPRLALLQPVHENSVVVGFNACPGLGVVPAGRQLFSLRCMDGIKTGVIGDTEPYIG